MGKIAVQYFNNLFFCYKPKGIGRLWLRIRHVFFYIGKIGISESRDGTGIVNLFKTNFI